MGFTGNLKIISDSRIRSVISKGPKYRFPTHIDFKKCREAIAGALNDKCNEGRAFFTSDVYKNDKLWSCHVCEDFVYLLDNIFIRFGTKVYRQTIGNPMGTNCVPLVADLFLSYDAALFSG